MSDTGLLPQVGGYSAPGRKLVPPSLRLTARQRAFIDAWFGDARFSGPKAVEQALGKSGYAAKKSATDLLARPAVQAEIARRFAVHGMGSSEVIARLAEMARADMADVAECMDAFGHLDWAKVRERGLGRMIRSVKRSKTGRDEVVLEPRQPALDMIGRHLGMWLDRLQVTSLDVGTLSDDQLRIIAGGGSL